MHELSICQALVRQVQAIATREHATSVQRVTIRLGVLSGVEPELLAQAFPSVRRGTLAESAELHIETVPLRVQCRDCGARSEATPAQLCCTACGSARTTLMSGDELQIASVELRPMPARIPDHV